MFALALKQKRKSWILGIYNRFLSDGNLIFQQDNHPAHTAINVQRRFTEKHEKEED